jgi:hypothetical protein
MPPSKFLVASHPKTSARGVRASLSGKKPTLSYEEALLIANVAVETVKGFLSVIAAAPPNRRAPVTAEFTKMLSLYLEAKFRSRVAGFHVW